MINFGVLQLRKRPSCCFAAALFLLLLRHSRILPQYGIVSVLAFQPSSKGTSCQYSVDEAFKHSRYNDHYRTTVPCGTFPTTTSTIFFGSSSDEDFYNDNQNNNNNNNNNDTAAGKSSSQSPSNGNEFSRTLQTNRIFSRRTTSTRHAMDELQNHQRDYELTIQATSDECMALCRRFELTQVNDLSASLKIRPAMGAIDNLVLPVEVEGSITASVTQTCVRSNEQFQVEVEFPIYCLVKPMSMEALWSSSSSTITSNNLMEDNDDYSTSKSKKKTNKRNNRRKNKAVHSLEDVWELQSAIQSNIRDANSGDDDTDDLNDPLALHASATLVEDESIYSSTSGRLDVGELVAQTFWLQLDPFPKKPGTGPMQMEITG